MSTSGAHYPSVIRVPLQHIKTIWVLAYDAYESLKIRLVKTVVLHLVEGRRVSMNERQICKYRSDVPGLPISQIRPDELPVRLEQHRDAGRDGDSFQSILPSGLVCEPRLGMAVELHPDHSISHFILSLSLLCHSRGAPLVSNLGTEFEMGLEHDKT